MRLTPDVLVIGGGGIGCAIAAETARQQRSVLLVDRGALGGEASSAAAGVLSVASGSEVDAARLLLRRASLQRFPVLAAELFARTGVDVGLSLAGAVEVCFTESEEATLRARAESRRAQGFGVEWLDRSTLRAAEPAVHREARAGCLFLGDGQVVSGQLLGALAAAARAHDAELVPGAAVLGSERIAGRVARVRIGPEWVTPEVVILAAGAWSPAVASLAPALPVAPVRGQMLALLPPAPLCTHVLSYGDDYLVPRGNEVLVGATMEQVGFSNGVTPQGMSALGAKIARLAPAGLEAPIARTWSGLRPHAPGGGPLLGRSRELENLFIATGHHRNGILLAPITAAIIAALLEGAPPLVDVGPFLPPAGAPA